ncbi:MAG: response regulator [Bacteroidia bacterium]
MNNSLAVIAEDEETIASILAQILKKNFNYDVTIATSYSQAFALLENMDPGLIFIDVNLGDGNGYDLLTALKSNQKWSGKVIMMSAHTNELESNDVFVPEADCFISKPFDKGEIVSAVRKVLSLDNN